MFEREHDTAIETEKGPGDGLMRGQRMLLAGRSSPPGNSGNGTPAQTVRGILVQQARGWLEETNCATDRAAPDTRADELLNVLDISERA